MNRNLLSRSLAAAVIGAAVSNPALTEPEHVHGAAAAAVTNLDGVVVLGVAPIAASTFVTDPKLPRQPVPASDGADYLKTIPGFSTLRSGGTNGDPVLRGMFGSRIALLTNDGALSGACPSRMDNAMSYIAPETYDRLTVIKGPQTVLWGGGASAGTVRFEREIPYFDRPGCRRRAACWRAATTATTRSPTSAPARRTGTRGCQPTVPKPTTTRDGNGDEVPSAWRKWNVDAALGWTPDADTVLELNAGSGDAQARYAGRGMDGAQFRRDGVGLRFEKKNIDGVLDAVAANVYRNEVDHVMDNYTLRDPDPASSMPMPMASNVGDTTEGGRVALTLRAGSLGVDRRRRRPPERTPQAQRDGPWRLPWTSRGPRMPGSARWVRSPNRTGT